MVIWNLLEHLAPPSLLGRRVGGRAEFSRSRGTGSQNSGLPGFSHCYQALTTALPAPLPTAQPAPRKTRTTLSSPHSAHTPGQAMSSSTRVMLVTGADKGIGFAVVRDLCRQFSGDVVLTARDAARGPTAVQLVQAEGLCPLFHQLDIDLQSIHALRDFLHKEYGILGSWGLDVLVNNAGIAFQCKWM